MLQEQIGSTASRMWHLALRQTAVLVEQLDMLRNQVAYRAYTDRDVLRHKG